MESVLEDIKENCSLINLDLSGNNIKEDLIEQLNNEL
jgi:Ran GTPase-activating protein (RanGAP) involved in mRNA processing and transport